MAYPAAKPWIVRTPATLQNESANDYQLLSDQARLNHDNEHGLSEIFHDFFYILQNENEIDGDEGESYRCLLQWLGEQPAAAKQIKHLTLRAEDTIPAHRISVSKVWGIVLLAENLRELELIGNFHWVKDNTVITPEERLRTTNLDRLTVTEVYSEAFTSCLELLELSSAWECVKITDIDHAGHSCWNNLAAYDVRILEIQHCKESDVVLSLPNVEGIFRGIERLVLGGLDRSHAEGFVSVLSAIRGTLLDLRISLAEGEIGGFHQWNLIGLRSCSELIEGALELPLEKLGQVADNATSSLSTAIVHFARNLPRECIVAGFRFRPQKARPQAGALIASVDWSGVGTALVAMSRFDVLFCELNSAWRGQLEWHTAPVPGVDLLSVQNGLRATGGESWNVYGVLNGRSLLALGCAHPGGVSETWLKDRYPWRAVRV